ncbi:hypothetical protein [Olsenella sp. HMSC062G07]|uniref:hypothetical protein n=1 Tax=Olsenella sp. HMSC062G07 TaxID=1739330 RepID=UPI001FED7471|nr:hypothetical protein [Olsenella sp. HMSC062G07]
MGEPKTRQFHARVSESDYERTVNLAKSLGISQAELVRLLMQLPIEDIGQENVNKFVVLDLATADRMYREMRHWGYQRNQGMHALNSIAYYLRLNKLDAPDVMDGYVLVSERFDAIERTAKEIALKIDALAQARFLFRQARHADRQTDIRTHLLQGHLPLPHQGRTRTRLRLPEPRHPRARGHRL